MAVGLIISYDGTPNDDDGLSLGRMLAAAGASLALAYVRHSREYDPRREELAEHDAHRRLELGAVWLEAPDVPRHVVMHPSTGAGLSALAAAESAAMVVFGSDYRTSPGRVEPGSAAQTMLEGGSVPVGVAVAGLRTSGRASITTISFFGVDGDDAPAQTAHSLAEALGASVTADGEDHADLVVVGSQPSAQPGRIALSGATRARLEAARCSAVVLAHGTPILF